MQILEVHMPKKRPGNTFEFEWLEQGVPYRSIYILLLEYAFQTNIQIVSKQRRGTTIVRLAAQSQILRNNGSHHVLCNDGDALGMNGAKVGILRLGRLYPTISSCWIASNVGKTMPWTTHLGLVYIWWFGGWFMIFLTRKLHILIQCNKQIVMQDVAVTAGFIKWGYYWGITLW